MIRTLKTFILIVVCFTSTQVCAQSDSSKSQKIVGFDANTLLGQVVPFSNFQQDVGFPAVVVRRLWNGHGYRTAAGIDFDGNSGVENFYLSFGYARRKQLGPKYYYTTGLEFRLISTQDFFNDFVGIANYWGFEYQLNKVVSLSTEAALQLAIVDIFNLSVTPPVRIQCHFRLK